MDTLMVLFVLQQMLHSHEGSIAYIYLSNSNFLTVEFELGSGDAFRTLERLNRLSKGSIQPPGNYMRHYLSTVEELNSSVNKSTKLEHLTDRDKEKYSALLQVLRSDENNNALCIPLISAIESEKVEKDAWTISAGQRWEAEQEAQRQAILEGREGMLSSAPCDRVFTIDSNLLAGGAPDLTRSSGMVMPGVAAGIVEQEKEEGWEEKRIKKSKSDTALENRGLCSGAKTCAACGACFGVRIRMYSNIGYKMNSHKLVLSWSTVPAWLYKKFWEQCPREPDRERDYRMIEVALSALLRWCECGYRIKY